jgi:hypothetical protein
MEPKKIRRPRLRQLKSLISETLLQLDALAADETQSPSKRAAAILQKASLLQSMYVSQSEERKVTIKFGDDKPDKPEPKPKVVTERPKETLEERLARLKGETV